MKKLIDVMGSELEWTQPSGLKQNYELRAGTELVARLRFRSIVGSFATAETANERWTFKRVGIWQARITVRLPDAEDDLAVFHMAWNGTGKLEFPDGRIFRTSTNLWQTQYGFETEKGEKLVGFGIGGIIRHSAKVTIDPSATGRTELPLLVTLGWYLAIVMQQEAADVGSM